MRFGRLRLRKLHSFKRDLEPGAQVRNERGFGLIEVVVVVAIISIVALGIATMMQDMFTQQQRASQKATLNSTRARLIESLQSPSSWAATIAHADNTSSLACLRAGGSCTHNTTVTFNIADSAGNIIYPSATATAGFRPDGTNCDSFSTSTPDPSCPFRWAFSAVLTCPSGSGTCPSPDIHISAPFSYAAGENGFGAGFNPNTYSIDFRRGADVILNQRVVFRYTRATDTAVPPEGEAGAVCENAWITRQLNVSENPNAIAGVALASNQFTLPTGSYNCRVLVPGFRNGGNRVRVQRMPSTTEAESGIALASVNPGGSVVNSLELIIRVNGTTATFEVQQYCTEKPTNSPWGPGNIDTWGRGVPVPVGGNYDNVTYSTVTCTRTGA